MYPGSSEFLQENITSQWTTEMNLYVSEILETGMTYDESYAQIVVFTLEPHEPDGFTIYFFDCESPKIGSKIKATIEHVADAETYDQCIRNWSYLS